MIFFLLKDREKDILGVSYLKKSLATRKITIFQNLFSKVSRYIIAKRISFSYPMSANRPYYSPPLVKVSKSLFQLVLSATNDHIILVFVVVCMSLLQREGMLLIYNPPMDFKYPVSKIPQTQ